MDLHGAIAGAEDELQDAIADYDIALDELEATPPREHANRKELTANLREANRRKELAEAEMSRLEILCGLSA